jgi:creatinine amidohydrolase
VLVELLGSVRRHGFRRVLVVNGHGGNTPARPAAEAWADGHEGVSLRWHDWWSAPATRWAVDAIDPTASHASWMEGFPWTRVEGVVPPAGRKPPVDVSQREALSLARFRDRVGDGSFGGYYERSEAEMLRLWAVAVEETRVRLEEGW